MKRFIKFIKNNKIGSSAFEAMIVVPLWLATLIFIGRTLIISNSRYTLAHESLAIGSIVSQSKSKEEAIETISEYLTIADVDGIEIDGIDMWLLTKSNEQVSDWDISDAGETIKIRVTINTPFDDMRFSSMEIGGQTVYFFPPEFTNEFSVVLNFK